MESRTPKCKRQSLWRSSRNAIRLGVDENVPYARQEVGVVDVRVIAHLRVAPITKLGMGGHRARSGCSACAQVQCVYLDVAPDARLHCGGTTDGEGDSLTRRAAAGGNHQGVEAVRAHTRGGAADLSDRGRDGRTSLSRAPVEARHAREDGGGWPFVAFGLFANDGCWRWSWGRRGRRAGSRSRRRRHCRSGRRRRGRRGGLLRQWYSQCDVAITEAPAVTHAVRQRQRDRASVRQLPPSGRALM